jgi:SAM-dependent methyltransferase
MHPSDLGPLLHADHTLPPCPRNRFYHEHVKELVAGAVAPGQRVLDLGCGTGDVLATVRPSPGLGLNVGDQLTQLAREKYPDLSADRRKFRPIMLRVRSTRLRGR